MQIQGTIGNVANNANGSGTTPTIVAGPSGDLLTGNVHGRFYNAALRGCVFSLATVAAGTTIPVQATNLVSTFTLWNPAGSGKNVELIRYTLGLTTATTVVGDIGLYVQTGVGSTVTAPGTLTALTIRNALLGAGLTSVCTGYSAATLVNVVGTNCFRHLTLAGPGATSTTNVQPINYDFDGMVIVPPGGLITTAGFAAQTAAMCQTLIFAEYPIIA